MPLIIFLRPNGTKAVAFIIEKIICYALNRLITYKKGILMKKLFLIMLALSVASLQAGDSDAAPASKKRHHHRHRTSAPRSATDAASTPSDSTSSSFNVSSLPSLTWRRVAPAVIVVAALLAYMQNCTEH